MVGAVSSQYVTVRKQRDTVSEEGWNSYFSNYDPKRIVVEKNDRSPFTKADYEAIENAPHVAKLVREDMMFDSQVYIENEDFLVLRLHDEISTTLTRNRHSEDCLRRTMR